MADLTFLDKLATQLLAYGAENLRNVTVVLPSRRAKVFLLEALRKKIPATVFAPEIISIERFVEDLSGMRTIDSIETLFEFHEVYRKLNPAEAQPFEIFANWAKMLLQDFNELDRYLLPPDHLLSYLRDIEDLKRWNLKPTERTELIDNYVRFWNKLPEYYHALYAHLKNAGKGYQGLIYREAIANLDRFSDDSAGRQFVFAGFNALNAAEEKIFQHLLARDMAAVLWDIDATFLNDQQHDAGLFVRRFRRSWPHYKSNPFNWISTEFAAEKRIEIIGTPKSIGQARIAGDIVRDLAKQGDLKRTALVLGDEQLLLPILFALPAETGPLNITMGFSGKSNPAQVLLAKLFRLHLNAISRNPRSYVFYFKDVLDILTHPLVAPYVKAANLVNRINRNNITFITIQRLAELHPGGNVFFKALFDKWPDDAPRVLDRMSSVLLNIKALMGDGDRDKVARAFLYSIFKVINKLKSYFDGRPGIGDLQTLHVMYRQIVDMAEVSFEGEPLSGLQVMGVLESRTLDFDTVIVTSLNEGKFPAGKSQQSFIPYDVKREMGLPTFKEKDAIYTYHFYHLLQRAKNVYLIYNTESEGLDGGEKSRFITQLEVERQPSHRLVQTVYHADVPPDTVPRPMMIPKSEKVLERLAELCQTGFSPSALTKYIRDPLEFYFQRVLRISEADQVEEDIAINTLGTIIHGALEELYRPFIGKRLDIPDLQRAMSGIEAEVMAQFSKVYREGDIKKGRNLLAFEVAKRHVGNFLKAEIATLEETGDEVEILALESRFERQLVHPILPQPVLIGGSVDRIERRNGRIRIVDYKTGKVEKGNVVLKDWEGLTADTRNDKIIQVLAYAFLYEPEADAPVEAGIISFKNMKSGFLPYTAPGNSTIITSEIIARYTEQLAHLLSEILDPDTPFAENQD
jgi:hypothetical protein